MNEEREPLLKEETESFSFVNNEEKTVVIGEPVKEPKKKKFEKDKIITIILSVIVLIVVGRSLYNFYIGFKYYDLRFESEEVNNNEQTENEATHEEEVSVSSVIVNETYNKLNVSSRNETVFNALYNENGVTVVDDTLKLSLAFNKLGINCDNQNGQVTEEDLTSALNELFNDSSSISVLSNSTENTLNNYVVTYENDTYNVTCNSCIETDVEKNISKATTKDDELNIYEVVNETTYKWIYKKGTGSSYYFVSINPVQ